MIAINFNEKNLQICLYRVGYDRGKVRRALSIGENDVNMARNILREFCARR